MTTCRLYITLLLSLIVAAPSWARERAQGYCQQGGVTVSISGMSGYQATPKVLAAYPGCTVNVYISGTLNPATIYADNNGTTKSNPFTADSTTGVWFFYADNGHYDIVTSGGTMPSPVTLGDKMLSDLQGLANAAGALYYRWSNTGTQRTIQNKLDESVSVYDFGAVGDGLADDLAAFNAAVTALPARGGKIKVPNGRYKLSGTWVINKPGITVEGCGSNQSPVFDASDTAACKIDYQGTLAAPAISIQANQVVLDGFSIGNSGAMGTLGIEIKGNYFKAQHVAILNPSNGFTVSAIKTDGAAVRQQIYIDDVFAQGNASGIILEQTIAARITRFRSVKNGVHAIQVGPTVSCFDVNIDGSIFDVFDTDSLTASAIELNKINRVRITGNYFEMAEWDSVKNPNANGQLVLKLNPTFNNDNMGVTFADNWVQGNQVINYAIGSPNTLTINGLNVTGNLFRDVVTAGINVPGANPTWVAGNAKWGVTPAISATALTSVANVDAGIKSGGTIEAVGTLKADTQIQASAVQGTAPITVVSSTPISTMVIDKHPQVYDSSSTQMTGSHINLGATNLGAGGSATINFTGSAVYQNSSSYVCTGTDVFVAQPVTVQRNSGTQITILGTINDSVSYICIGK